MPFLAIWAFDILHCLQRGSTSIPDRLASLDIVAGLNPYSLPHFEHTSLNVLPDPLPTSSRSSPPFNSGLHASANCGIVCARLGFLWGSIV